MPFYPLAESDVHLWFLPWDLPEADQLCEESLDLLSPDEGERYRSYLHPGRARQFLLGRLLMRRSLAAHLAVSAAELRFVYGPNGKPELVADTAAELAFSLSHGRAGAVVAVACADRLGVDLEPLGRASTVLRIARRFFSEAEIRHLESRGANAAHEAIALWCLKESIVKATGGTIWEGLSGVNLELDGGRIHWLTSPPEGRESEWLLLCGRYPPDCALALALKRSNPITRPQEVFTHILGSLPATDAIFRIRYASGWVTTRSSPG